MIIRNIGKLFSIILFLVIVFFIFYENSPKKSEKIITEKKASEELKYNSNIIENVKYISSDADGNRYTISKWFISIMVR